MTAGPSPRTDMPAETATPASDATPRQCGTSPPSGSGHGSGSDPAPRLRELAENLWEALGGDLCICQRAEVVHWCEKCQQRIGLIQSTLAAAVSVREGPQELVRYNCDCLPAGPDGTPSDAQDATYCERWVYLADAVAAKLAEADAAREEAEAKLAELHRQLREEG